MLQTRTFTEQSDEIAETITIPRILGMVKRRFFLFLIPFLLVLSLGSVVAMKWPAQYVSAGTILVASQQIPRDLVQPTVVSLANERIQVIEQRIMTRDNLIALAKKFNISSGWRGSLMGLDIADFIRARTSITPVEMNLPSDRKQAIAFKVGFQYEDPVIATKVANELVTMILSEDAQSRRNYATETTVFLETDVQRLEAQLNALDGQINKLRRESINSASSSSPISNQDQKNLADLKAQLAIKRATLSDLHPDVVSLKRKIAALEALVRSGETNAVADQSEAKNPTQRGLGLDTLETKRASLKKELENASQKLATARLGQNLESGQHSERLEVIEQPSYPTKPLSPNRPKLLGVVVALAFMLGGALAAGTEFLDGSIRDSSDLFTVVAPQTIVSIPYIKTKHEILRRRKKYAVAILLILLATVASVFVLLYFGPDPDLLTQKALGHLLK